MDPSAIFATQLPQAASINEQMEKLHKVMTRILGTATPAVGLIQQFESQPWWWR